MCEKPNEWDNSPYIFHLLCSSLWGYLCLYVEDDDYNFKRLDRVKNIHPELRDIKPGEELLVFQVKEEKD